MLPPAQVFQISATSADVVVFTGAAVLRGWSLRETTASAVASCILRDGTRSTAPEAGSCNLIANESDREWFAGNGILLRQGAFLDLIAGSVAGVLYLNPVSSADDLAFAFGQDGPYMVHPNA